MFVLSVSYLHAYAFYYFLAFAYLYDVYHYFVVPIPSLFLVCSYCVLPRSVECVLAFCYFLVLEFLSLFIGTRGRYSSIGLHLF